MTNTDILLCTFNSTYQHCAFGLRYLQANLAELRDRSQILETTIKDNPRNFAEKILNHRPRIVGFGIYIWNTRETLECIMVLKKVAPELIIVLGGPEISYETSTQPHLAYCDYVIQGEADFSFRDLCRKLLASPSVARPSQDELVPPSLPEVAQIALPYELYNAHDIQNRILYVEASRGCPYRCEYCLSSLDKSVRSFDLEQFLNEMRKLIERGARTFKFVDRTFNLSPSTSTRILSFFLEYIELGLFLHFEMVPDRLPAEIRELIVKFPAGSLQFEIGIQTLNPIVAQNVSRKNDLLKVADNFKFLREHTQVHTHADLIVGLPGEDFDSFAMGFDRLAELAPDEIQVGILKRLKGTPIARHEVPRKMHYSENPPYQILSTDTLDFICLQKLGRFAKFWDLYANSGEFKELLSWMRAHPIEQSFFRRFFDFSEFLTAELGETHSLSLNSLSEKAWQYLQQSGLTSESATSLLASDYLASGERRQLPPFLRGGEKLTHFQKEKTMANRRQLKHLELKDSKQN